MNLTIFFDYAAYTALYIVLLVSLSNAVLFLLEKAEQLKEKLINSIKNRRKRRAAHVVELEKVRAQCDEVSEEIRAHVVELEKVRTHVVELEKVCAQCDEVSEEVDNLNEALSLIEKLFEASGAKLYRAISETLLRSERE